MTVITLVKVKEINTISSSKGYAGGEYKIANPTASGTATSNWCVLIWFANTAICAKLANIPPIIAIVEIYKKIVKNR